MKTSLSSKKRSSGKIIKKLSDQKIRSILEKAYRTYHHPDLLCTDPLGFVHKFKRNEQEVIGFIVALFSYGRVNSIIKFSESLFSRLGSSPKDTIEQIRNRQDALALTKNLVYRFYSAEDIADLLLGLSRSLKNYSSLADCYLHQTTSSNEDNLWKFQNYIYQQSNSDRESPGKKFMFCLTPLSAAKRWRMYLRWMIRKDEVDLGLWNFLSTSKLVLPLDVHLFQITKALGLSQRSTGNLKTSLEITSRFKDFDEHDPLRFDFSLCRIGVLGKKPSFFKHLERGSHS